MQHAIACLHLVDDAAPQTAPTLYFH
jgi:hypothetical protein